MLSNFNEKTRVDSNIEPSINATSNLSNDSGSSKRATVIRIPECVKKLSSKNKNCKLSVTNCYTTNQLL